MLGADKQPKEYPSSLEAWDPVNQKLIWSVPQDNFWNAGTLTTAGNLVFQGRADGKFLAYNAKTGAIVWTFDAGLGISAPPITYKINGKQYISLLVGFGGGYARGGFDVYKLGWAYRMQTRRLITFSLDGNADMPAMSPPFYPEPIIDPNFKIDNELARQGSRLYGLCFNCHGGGMYAGGMSPDLRASPIPLDKEAFAMIVRDGFSNDMGMPAYPEATDEHLEALRHFIRKRATETRPEYEAFMNNQKVDNKDVNAGH
jgi:quinohemoprotein ethanol dehydrogenase